LGEKRKRRKSALLEFSVPLRTLKNPPSGRKTPGLIDFLKTSRAPVLFQGELSALFSSEKPPLPACRETLKQGYLTSEKKKTLGKKRNQGRAETNHPDRALEGENTFSAKKKETRSPLLPTRGSVGEANGGERGGGVSRTSCTNPTPGKGVFFQRGGGPPKELAVYSGPVGKSQQKRETVRWEGGLTLGTNGAPPTKGEISGGGSLKTFFGDALKGKDLMKKAMDKRSPEIRLEKNFFRRARRHSKQGGTGNRVKQVEWEKNRRNSLEKKSPGKVLKAAV